MRRSRDAGDRPDRHLGQASERATVAERPGPLARLLRVRPLSTPARVAWLAGRGGRCGGRQHSDHRKHRLRRRSRVHGPHKHSHPCFNRGGAPEPILIYDSSFSPSLPTERSGTSPLKCSRCRLLKLLAMLKTAVLLQACLQRPMTKQPTASCIVPCAYMRRTCCQLRSSMHGRMRSLGLQLRACICVFSFWWAAFDAGWNA